MSTQITNTVKAAFETMTSTTKIADLKNDTVHPAAGDGLTTDFGQKVSNTDDWLKVGGGQYGGPSLLEDQIAREKIHRFDHERIPERVVHARGAGAHGYFKAFGGDAAKYTSAGVLTDSSRTTPVFTRFSTVQGSRGSADTVRDVRGFAVKFYTEEGNWDLVGNNIPVFFIQDAIKFPDFVHSVKPEPHNEVPQGQSAHNNFWDFVGLQPEATHMVMWAMSDRGIPRSYRMMQGFGVNTYTLVNAAGQRHFVKFHWFPELGVHSLVWDEALKLAGQDPDFHRKDLHEAIDNKAYPKWTLKIQVVAEADEHNFTFDILDATKMWPVEEVPLIDVGEMVLDKTVDEYFPETEQVAFCTSHIVPGIGFSDDPLLQGRNFSYQDTQISRLGVNWEELPINRPVCPVMNHNRDGAMRHRITKGEINYWPNRKDVGRPVPAAQGGYVEYPQKVEGIKQRVRGPKFQEHYSQASLFYNSLAAHEKTHLTSAICFELSHCDDPVVYESYMNVLVNVDAGLAKQVAVKINGKLPLDTPTMNHGRSTKLVSQVEFAPATPTVKSRRIAILIADGFNAVEMQSVRGAFTAAGAVCYIIGPRRSVIHPSAATDVGPSVVADHHFEGQRSTMFDALYIPSGADHAATLSRNGRAVHWVREAFGHLKPIGAMGEAVEFLRQAVQLPNVLLIQPELASSGEVVSDYGVVTGTANGGPPHGVTDALRIGQDKTGFIGSFAYEISKHRCYEREADGLVDMIAF